jgi:hypothetical protein
MFSFSNIGNLYNENYNEDVIKKQSKNFLKIQEKHHHPTVLHEGFSTNETKGKSSFNDPTPKHMSNFMYSNPNDQTVRRVIDISNRETKNTSDLVRQASYINNPSVTEVSNEFMSQLNDYTKINDNILKNTKEYIDKGDSSDVNVVVDQLSNDNNIQYINLYNTDSSNPNILSYNNQNIDTCKNIARIKGYDNFSLSNTDDLNNSQCNISKDISNLTKNGIYIPNCKVGTDGKIYGGGWGNAIYENVGNVPTYIGCYKDAPERAMIAAGSEEHNNPVYEIGYYGCAPWGSSWDFPNSTAQWIWYTENAGNGAPANNNNPVTIRGVLNRTSQDIIYCEICCIGDDICDITVNGSRFNQKLNNNDKTDSRKLKCVPEPMTVRYPGGGKTGYIVPLLPGKNIIDLSVVNTGGPAGVILCLMEETIAPIIENDALTIQNATTGVVPIMVTNNNWHVLLNNNNAITPLSQSFSVEECGKYAYDNGFQYFGVQNMMNNNPNSAQCFISNDLSEATKYGKWEGGKTYNGDILGLGNIASVYSFKSSGNYENMGKVGYINEENQLLEYPSSMIQYGTSNTYTSFMNINSRGNDIEGSLKLNKQDCEKKCNDNKDCYGYLTYNSNQCWLKNKNVFSYTNKTGPFDPENGYDLYIKDVEILNNDSCPKNIKKINSLEWDNYNKSKEIMNMDTTCRLDRINRELIEEKNQKETLLNWITSQLSKGLSSFMTTNKTMTQQMETEHDVMKNNLSLYDNLNNKYEKMKSADTSNLNNILVNSQITILQSRYFYVLWVILAIAIFISLFMLIRKFTNPQITNT